MFCSGLILVVFIVTYISTFFFPRVLKEFQHISRKFHYLTFPAGSTESGTGGFCGFKKLGEGPIKEQKFYKGGKEISKDTMIQKLRTLLPSVDYFLRGFNFEGT